MKKFAWIFTLALCIGIGLFLVFGQSPLDLYIDASAGDGGDGSQETPYNEFSDINWSTGGDNSVFDAIQAGQDVNINLKKGEEWREQLTVGTSGVSGHPITIQAYGSGVDPIINGADLVATWTETDKIIPNPEDFSQWDNTAVTVTTSQATAPDGNNTADRAVTTNPSSRLRQTAAGISVTAETDYTFSFYAKNNGGTTANYSVYDGSNGAFILNMVSYIGSINASTWTRIDVGFTTPAGCVLVKLYVLHGDTDADLYLWGAMLNEGTEPEPYMYAWKATLNTEPSIVIFNDNLGTKETSLASIDTEYDWYWASNVLYIYSTSDPDINYTNPGIEAGQRDYAIYCPDRDYITIDGLEGGKVNKSVIRFDQEAIYGVVQNCTLKFAYRAGIMLQSSNTGYLTTNANTISYCGYWDAQWYGGIQFDTGAATNSTLQNDIISYCNCGIYIGEECDGNTLTGITSHHNKYMGFNVLNSINNSFATCVSYNNPGYSGYGGGFYIDGTVGGGGSDNNNLNRCLSHDDYVGFTYTNYSTGGIMSYCIAYASTYIGFAIDSQIDGATLYNCISANAGQGGSGTDFWLVSTGADVTNVTIKNCIGYNSDKRPLTVDPAVASGTFIFDYNCWYNTSGDLIQYGNDLYTLAQFLTYQSEKSQDANSIAQDPLLTDPANGDFTLQSGSPCKDTGTNVSLTQDYAGTTLPSGSGYDIGAYELLQANHLVVTGTASMTAGNTNELTITAYDVSDNLCTNYEGSKSLIFSGPSNSPNGSVPTVEGTNIGSSTNVSFTSGQSNATAATLTAYCAESTTVDVSDGTINSEGDASYDLDLTVTAGSATRLLVTGTSSMTAGTTNELTVTAGDNYSNTDTTYTGSKSLTFSGPGNATDGSIPTVEGTNVGSSMSVTFASGVSNTGAATLTAYNAELTAVDVTDSVIDSTGDPSFDLDLTVGPDVPIEIAYNQQPSDAAVNSAMSPSVTINSRDQFENVCSDDNSTSVTVALGANLVEATLSGSLVKTVVSGVATFNDLVVNKPGIDFTLSGTASGMSSIASNAFNITGSDETNYPDIYIDSSVAGGGDGSQSYPYNEFADINWTTGGDNSVYDGVQTGENVTINLKKGKTWDELMTIGASGLSGNPITIKAYSSGNDPIIDGESTRQYCININSKDYINIENLNLTGATTANLLMSGDYCITKYSRIHDGDAIGISMTGNYNIIMFSLIYDNGDDGIAITGTGNTIYNTVIYDSTGAGFDVDESCTITNCIVRNSTGDDINIAGTKTVTGTYNCFQDSIRAGSGTYLDGASTTLWATDPLFTNPGSLDFTLQDSSPCVNTGTEVYAGNIQTNADMETNDYWVAYGDALQSQGGAPHSGSYDWDVVTVSVNGGIKADTDAYATVVEGKAYLITVWVYNVDWPSVTATFGVTGDGTGSLDTSTSTQACPQSTWTPCQLEATATASGTIRLFVSFPVSSSTFAVDDFTIEELADEDFAGNTVPATVGSITDNTILSPNLSANLTALKSINFQTDTTTVTNPDIGPYENQNN